MITATTARRSPVDCVDAPRLTMWMINNQTPFAAERDWVRDANGAEVWTVAVRATFNITATGGTELADKQVDVVGGPVFRGDPSQSSLLYDSDRLHKKLATDVILHGHAYAPGGRPAPQVDVALLVADSIAKRLRVFGDRVWRNSVLGLKLSKPEPFTQMPITYERAFGGTDQVSDNPKHHGWERRNPVGVGFATQDVHLADRPVSNVEDPNDLIRSWKDRSRPAGFGPIASHWSPRIELAGTYDDKWQKERLPLLPVDFDERFYNCAPVDQQVPGFLRGGEEVTLHNLTPEGCLSFRLPRVTLGFRTSFGDGEVRYHRGVLHTVTLEPDFPRVMMVWHTNLPCHFKVQELLETVIYVKQRIHVSERDRASGMWMGETKGR